MSKKKRVRRDVEKFFRVGRYWNFLQLLEEEGLVTENAREHQEAWKAVTKRALVNEGAFDEFCREVRKLKVFPSLPDFRFLMHLKGVFEGRGSAEDIPEVKGLSPDAEKLRLRLTNFAASSSNYDKLHALLEKFIREPGTITRRFYEQVADLMPLPALKREVRRIGESIPSARRLNHKAAVARGWDGIDMTRLRGLDTRLHRISRLLPETLVEILLHPFVHNLAVMCRRLASETSTNHAARLVRAIPFLLPRLAGAKMKEVESKVLINRGEWTAGGANDLRVLREKLNGLSIEEKVSLLSGLRQRMEEVRPERSPFDELDFLYDDDDEDEDEYEEEDYEDADFLDREDSQARNLARGLLLMHQSILKDVASRMPQLSAREKKELTRVMEPVLLRDLDHTFDAFDVADEFLNLLEAAAEAGCIGTRIALLTVLAGAQYRKNDLRKRGEKILNQLSAPTSQDMQWLAEEWDVLYYPSVRSLKPLLARYKDDPSLVRVFGDEVCRLLLYDLAESMVRKELTDVPRSFLDMFGGPKRKDLGIVRRELAELTDYRVLDLARDFLHCYPEDRLTTEGHLCCLNLLYSAQGPKVWEEAAADLRRYRTVDKKSRRMVPLESFQRLFREKAEAAVLFMAEHLDELATLSVERLGSFLNEILDSPALSVAHSGLFIRLEKLLDVRVAAGEEDIRPLRDRIRQALKELTKSEKKTPKPRKSRR